MFSKFATAILFPLSLMIFALAPAHASTVTLNFDNISNSCGVCGPGFPTSIVEQGYTIGGSPADHSGSGSVHLDDGGTSFSNFVTISNTAQFAVASLRVIGYGSNFLDGNDRALAFNNVLFQGFRKGALVTSSVFSTGIVGGIFDVSLGNLFSNLDTFKITQTGPPATDFQLNRGSYCATAPCDHVDIDNVTLISAVPLPAMAPGFFGILGLMGFYGRKRKIA